MTIQKKILVGGVVFLLIFSITLPTTTNAETESPKKQMQRGTLAADVICKEDLELVIRTTGFAACVRPATADKMQKNGLLLMPIGFADLNKEKGSVPAKKEQEARTLDDSIGITKAGKEIETVPASSLSIVNFYITDHDLNVAHNGVEVIPTEGLFEFTVNGIPIEGPANMIETGPNTGQFYVKLELPETINGRQLSQDDIVLIKYLDESDFSGERRILTKSVPLTKTFANIQTSGGGGGGSRIGHEFTIRIYEPDANRDSKDEDKIPLSLLEYRGEGGIRTTLANPKFDANSASLIETGPNTGTFEVQIKIPREIDGKIVHIGDWYEIRYIDKSTPSNTDEKIILKSRIG